MVFHLGQVVLDKVMGKKVVVRFNPMGTHSQHGYMKVLMEFYPRKSDRTWAEGESCVSYLIKIGQLDTPATLAVYIRDMWPKKTWKALDNAIADGDQETIDNLTNRRERTALTERGGSRTMSGVNQQFQDFEVYLG